jgi:hypothetical protein
LLCSGRTGCLALYVNGQSRRSKRCGYDGFGLVLLTGSNAAHGLIERHAQYIDEQVDGVALASLVRPSPEVVFDDESGAFDEFEVSSAGVAQGEAFVPKQIGQVGAACGTNVFLIPCYGGCSPPRCRVMLTPLTVARAR